jgi:hypothetical protein
MPRVFGVWYLEVGILKHELPDTKYHIQSKQKITRYPQVIFFITLEV